MDEIIFYHFWDIYVLYVDWTYFYILIDQLQAWLGMSAYAAQRDVFRSPLAGTCMEQYEKIPSSKYIPSWSEASPGLKQQTIGDFYEGKDSRVLPFVRCLFRLTVGSGLLGRFFVDFYFDLFGSLNDERMSKERINHTESQNKYLIYSSSDLSDEELLKERERQEMVKTTDALVQILILFAWVAYALYKGGGN